MISCECVADLIQSPRWAAALRPGIPRMSMMISASANSATLRVFENGGQLEVTLKLVLSPSGEETELESKFIAIPHGFIRAIFPIFKAQLKAQEKENMINLKKALEGN